MTIEGIGVDIEDISRFTGKPFPENKGFYERIFTKKEIEYCLQKANPYQHFAARFCAKEAVIKALSDETLDFRKIEILKETNAPKIKIESYPNVDAKVSLSHTATYAVASVIINRREEN